VANQNITIVTASKTCGYENMETEPEQSIKRTIDTVKTAYVNGYSEGQANYLALWPEKDVKIFFEEEVICGDGSKTMIVYDDGTTQTVKPKPKVLDAGTGWRESSYNKAEQYMYAERNIALANAIKAKEGKLTIGFWKYSISENGKYLKRKKTS
jgi:hypothetical protein